VALAGALAALTVVNAASVERWISDPVSLVALSLQRSVTVSLGPLARAAVAVRFDGAAGTGGSVTLAPAA
jgi:hypothetical protein